MCGQHNVRATAGDDKEQNTDKKHTPTPRIEIKIPDPAGNEPGPPGWKAGTPIALKWLSESPYKPYTPMFLRYSRHSNQYSGEAVFIINNHHRHQNVLSKGRSFTANARTKVAVLSKDRSSNAISGTKGAVLLGIGVVAYRCFLHPTLSLASEQTLKDLKRSQGHQHGG